MARRRGAGGGIAAGIGAALLAAAGFGGAQAPAPAPYPIGPTPPPSQPGLPYPGTHAPTGAHRINAGETVLFRFRMQPATAIGVISAVARVLYDDGTSEDFAVLYTNASTATVNPWVSRLIAAGMTNYIGGTTPGQPKTARLNGWVTNLSIQDTGTTALKKGEGYAEAFLGDVSGNDTNLRDILGKGYLFGIDTSPDMGAVFLNQFQPLDFLATYVVQGTVAEDATAGTHICSLTVSPGAGSEFQFVYGGVLSGNTATAQNGNAFIDDGTNVLTRFMNGTVLGQAVFFSIPETSISAQTGTTGPTVMLVPVSGTMRLILQVTTAAVSVTQTFSVVLRLKGKVPTFTFADTVGAPTLTTNTSTIFG